MNEFRLHSRSVCGSPSRPSCVSSIESMCDAGSGDEEPCCTNCRFANDDDCAIPAGIIELRLQRRGPSAPPRIPTEPETVETGETVEPEGPEGPVVIVGRVGGPVETVGTVGRFVETGETGETGETVEPLRMVGRTVAIAEPVATVGRLVETVETVETVEPVARVGRWWWEVWAFRWRDPWRLGAVEMRGRSAGRGAEGSCVGSVPLDLR